MIAIEVIGLLVTATTALMAGLPVALEYLELPEYLGNIRNLIILATNKLNLLECELSRVESEIGGCQHDGKLHNDHDASALYSQEKMYKDEEKENSCDPRDQRAGLVEMEIQYCRDFLEKSREFLKNFRNQVGWQEVTGEAQELPSHASPAQENHSSSYPFEGFDSFNAQSDVRRRIGHEARDVLGPANTNGKRRKQKVLDRLKQAWLNTQDGRGKMQLQCQLLQYFVAEVDGLRRSLQRIQRVCRCNMEYNFHSVPYVVPQIVIGDRCVDNILGQVPKIDNDDLSRSIRTASIVSAGIVACSIHPSHFPIVKSGTPVFTTSRNTSGAAQSSPESQQRLPVKQYRRLIPQSSLVYVVNGKKYGPTGRQLEPPVFVVNGKKYDRKGRVDDPSEHTCKEKKDQRSSCMPSPRR